MGAKLTSRKSRNARALNRLTVIKLHPHIAKLVKSQVSLFSGLPKTEYQKHAKTKAVTPDEIVNEILWCALRIGDISKHYTRL